MIGIALAKNVAGLLVWGIISGATPAGAEADATPGPAQVEALRTDLEEDPGAPVLGNPGGDVTVVEFLDYNCVACRAAQDVVEQLLAEDPGVRLVIHEWPTGGTGSEAAARAALAARAQGVDAFRVLHEAMLSLGVPAGKRPALVLAQVLGLDDALLERDMDAPAIADQIAASRRLAAALELAEAPAFVVGDQILQGPVTAGELHDAVATAREAG